MRLPLREESTQESWMLGSTPRGGYGCWCELVIRIGKRLWSGGGQDLAVECPPRLGIKTVIGIPSLK